MQANPNLSTTPPLPGVVAVPALNDALQTVATDFSGDTDPAALAWPLSKWADTSTGLLKRRNAAGTEWVVEGTLFRRSLSIIPADQIPDADVGLIAVPSQGLMQWNGTRYSVTNGAHGQCRFVFVSSTECRLMPCNGNGLVINGKQYRIPAGGVPLPIAAVSGANATANYVYAKDDGIGGVALEGVTTGHERHSDGVEIKTGDPTRTLVGVAYKNASGQFQHNASIRGTSSWFNRTYETASAVNFSAGTASPTPVEALGGVNVWTWAGESIDACINGGVAVTTPGASTLVYLYLDGLQVWSVGGTSSTAGANVPVCLALPSEDLIEGFHYVSTFLAVSGGGTSSCSLLQWIKARP